MEKRKEKEKEGGTHGGWGWRKGKGSWWLRMEKEEGCSGWGQRRGERKNKRKKIPNQRMIEIKKRKNKKRP